MTGAPAAPETDRLPPAQLATADLVCWLWAAIPHTRDGQIDTQRAATSLGVSVATIRRWLRDPHDWQLTEASLATLARRAILRGRGTYLWPALDPGSVARSHARLQVALANLVDARAGTIPPTWQTTGAMRPHQVHLVHYPKAHVHAIAVTTNRAGLARIHRQGVLHPEQAARYGGRILRSRTVANRWEAWTIKHRTLQAYADRRCITPRAFIEHGRTDTLHEDGPTPRFRSAPT